MARPKKSAGQKYSDTPRMFQKDNGYWCVRWRDTSKSKGYAEVSLETDDEDQAVENYAAYIGAWKRGEIAASPHASPQDHARSSYTVAQALRDWTRERLGYDYDEEAAKRGKKAGTYSQTKWLDQYFGDHPIAELGGMDPKYPRENQVSKPGDMTLSGYSYARMEGRFGYGREITPGTVYQELNLFRTVCNYAVQRQRIAQEHKPIFDLHDRPPNRHRWLRPDELLYVIENSLLVRGFGTTQWRKVDPDLERLPPLHRFIVLAYYAGSRRRAIEELRWDTGQIDWHGGFIYLNPPGRQQTHKRRSTVPITRHIRPWLERCYEERTGPYFLDDDKPQWQRVRTFFDHLNLHDCVAHTLRHSRITHLLQAGAKIEGVGALVGDSRSTIEQVYLHECPYHVRDMLEGGGGRPVPEVEGEIASRVFEAAGVVAAPSDVTALPWGAKRIG